MKLNQKIKKACIFILLLCLSNIFQTYNITTKFNKLKSLKKKAILNSFNKAKNIKKLRKNKSKSKQGFWKYLKNTVLCRKETGNKNTPNTTNANSLMSLRKFTTVIKALGKIIIAVPKFAFNVTKVTVLTLSNGLKYIVTKLYDFTYYIMSYMWTFLLRNVRSIENSLFYANAWINKPVDMLLMHVFLGIKWVGTKTVKKLLYLKNKIFKNRPNLNKDITEDVPTNIKDALQEKSKCSMDEVELLLNENELRISFSNKEYLNDDRNMYLMTSGFLYGIFYSLIPQDLNGLHNREKKKDDKEEEGYIDPETGKKIDPDDWKSKEDKNYDDQDIDSGNWDNKQTDDNPFADDNEIPNIPDDNEHNNIVPNDDVVPVDPNTDVDPIIPDYDEDLKRKKFRIKTKNMYIKSTNNNHKMFRKNTFNSNNFDLHNFGINVDYKQHVDYHGKCPIYHTGMVIDKIARNVSDKCALEAMNQFKPIIKSIVTTLTGTDFKENIINIKDVISGLNSNINKDISSKYKSKFDREASNPKEHVKNTKSFAKKLFVKFGRLFIQGFKNVGKTLKILKACSIKFGDEITDNFKAYSVYLASNTSLLPMNAFVHSLPIVKEIFGIFKIVLLVFMMWRILSFPYLIKSITSQIVLLEKELNNSFNFKKKKIESKLKQLKLKYNREFYNYGKNLSRVIIFAMQAIFYFTGINGIMHSISVSYFIGSIFIGLVRKLILKVKKGYNFIKNKIKNRKNKNNKNDENELLDYEQYDNDKKDRHDKDDDNNNDGDFAGSDNSLLLTSKCYKQEIIYSNITNEKRRKLVMKFAKKPSEDLSDFKPRDTILSYSNISNTIKPVIKHVDIENNVDKNQEFLCVINNKQDSTNNMEFVNTYMYYDNANNSTNNKLIKTLYYKIDCSNINKKGYCNLKFNDNTESNGMCYLNEETKDVKFKIYKNPLTLNDLKNIFKAIERINNNKNINTNTNNTNTNNNNKSYYSLLNSSFSFYESNEIENDFIKFKYDKDKQNLILNKCINYFNFKYDVINKPEYIIKDNIVLVK